MGHLSSNSRVGQGAHRMVVRGTQCVTLVIPGLNKHISSPTLCMQRTYISYQTQKPPRLVNTTNNLLFSKTEILQNLQSSDTYNIEQAAGKFSLHVRYEPQTKF